MAYPEHMNDTERKIIDVVVKKALAAGYKIEVWGDGELNLPGSSDYETITAEIAACSATELVIGDDEFFKLWVFLVHGNEDCVIVDYTAGDKYDTFLKEANDLGESLQ